MLDTIKCCLFSLGVGMVVGAYIAASNKKVQTAMKDLESKAEEKINEAKEGLEKIQSSMKKKQKTSGSSDKVSKVAKNN